MYIVIILRIVTRALFTALNEERDVFLAVVLAWASERRVWKYAHLFVRVILENHSIFTTSLIAT